MRRGSVGEPLTEEELINRGIRAEALLKDPVIGEAVGDLIKLITDQLLATKPEENKTRERLYYAYQGLNDLIGFLNQMIAIRIEIEKRRNGEELED